MIPIFIPLIISLVVLFASGDKQNIKIISGVICLFFVIIVCLFVNKENNIISKIPFTSIDKSSEINIGKDGVMYLESSYSSVLSNDYVLTGEFNEKDLIDWIDKTRRPINIHIKNRDEIIWSYSLGLSNSDSISIIHEIYENWSNDGIVPKDKIRYKFLCFYIDV